MQVFKSGLNRQLLFSLILSFLCINSASCQRQLSPQAIKAVNFFDAQQYSLACPQFKILLEKFPKDPLYQFYTGACLIETGFATDEAIFHLKAASIKNAHPHLYYYLGRAYYLQFKFDEAQNAYKELLANSKKQDIKELNIKEELKRIERARVFFLLAYDFDIFAKTSIKIDSLQNALSQWINVSEITNKSMAYALKENKNNDVYFSALSKSGNHKDIFRTSINQDGTASPENIGNNINTEFDEDFPVFVENENCLYFASKGHKSVGGFDIFVSKYKNGNWSIPEQLPFPINSPWNDYLFFPRQGEQNFLSDRNSSQGQIGLYQISPYQEANILNLSNEDEIQSVINKQAKKSSKISVRNSKNEDVKSIYKPLVIISASERIMLISKALTCQKSADSLLYISRHVKINLNNTDDKDQRNSMFRNISNIEKNSFIYQQKANDFYKRILESAMKSQTTAEKDSVKSSQKENSFHQQKNSAYSKEIPIPFDLVLPPGIIYRIQLGAFSKQPEFERFSGLTPLSAENLQDGKIIKYYVGVFYEYESAEKALKTVKNSGFKEAFVVSFYDNKKIPLERAKDLEKE